MSVIIVEGSGIIYELGRAVEDPWSPVREGRWKRSRQRWGQRELTPEGIAEVSC